MHPAAHVEHLTGEVRCLRRGEERDIAEFLAGEERLISHLAPAERDELTRLLRVLHTGL